MPSTDTLPEVATVKVSGADQGDSAPRPSRARTAKV